MTLVEFLLHRLDEDQTEAWTMLERDDPVSNRYGTRLLAECYAKHRLLDSTIRTALVVEKSTPGMAEIMVNSRWALRNAAAVYRGHADWDDKWDL